MVLSQISTGILDNWLIVSFSLFLLLFGTIIAYQRFGIKRVLLGKKNDDRDLIYFTDNNRIDWLPTFKTWFIILTGGMSLLSIFLLILILLLSFFYVTDINSTRQNDEILCQTFGTVFPSESQLSSYNNPNQRNLILGDIYEGKG